MKILNPASYLRLGINKIYIIAEKGKSPYIYGAKFRVNYVDYTTGEIGCTDEANKMVEYGYRRGYIYEQKTTGSLANDNTEFTVTLDLDRPMIIYEYQ